MPSADYFTAPHVVCRPALQLDAADVLEFTKFIWDGHDYIQYVWKDWFADPNGLLAVAQFGPHAVGLGKVTLLSPGQWWLEGLRVDPRFQGLKIGSHLHEYLDAWWLQHGDGTLRLMTSSKRVQVHHLCERTGYSKVSEVIGSRLSLSEGVQQSTFQLVGVDELGAARTFASVHLAHSNGLMDSGWRFSVPDEVNLAERLRLGRLHWWRGKLGLLATGEDDEDDGHVLVISFAAAAEPSLLPGLLRDSGFLAKQEAFAYVHWLAPVEPALQDALRQAGFAPDWDTSAYLYAKRHPHR